MKNFKKIISILLCVIMLTASVTSFASAEDAGKTGTAPTRLSVTVNGDTSTSRGFCWYTAEPTETKVEIIGLPASAYTVEDVICQEWEGSWMHKAVVTGLTPGMSYLYRVGDGQTWKEGMFRTDDGNDKIGFINIADVQASNLDSFQKGANTLTAAFRKLPAADFVSNCGDFTNDSTNEEWDLYDQAFGDMNRGCTLVPAPGNHDGLGVDYWFTNMFNLDTTESVETKTGVNYSFDYGNAHFAVINTNDLLSVSNSQLKWLENDMNSTDKDWKIVFFHKSPYTLGKDGKWPDALYLQKSLTKVLDACNVDFAFSGHDHQYLRTKPLTGNKLNENGTTYVLSGTAGSKRYEVRPFLQGHFMNMDFIDRLVIQREGYGNESPDHIGGCFETVEINGTTLTLKTYILNDETGDTNLVDEYVVTKAAGENKITFTGDNTTSELEYKANIVPSFLRLAVYAFGEWLPKFIIMVPALLDSVINHDIF